MTEQIAGVRIAPFFSISKEQRIFHYQTDSTFIGRYNTYGDLLLMIDI